MKVTVIDCSVSGHRETYYKQFAQTWAGMGYETSLIAPDGKGIQEAVAFQPVSALPLLPLPAGKPTDPLRVPPTLPALPALSALL